MGPGLTATTAPKQRARPADHTPKTTYLRARKSEQKEERRQVIIQVTRALYERAPFSDITMARVAADSGLAKGTVYGYFGTKEELFLALTDEELKAWLEELNTRLAALRSPDVDAVVDVLCHSLSERSLLPRLLAILHPVLEQNISHDLVRQFKVTMVMRGAVSATSLETVLPFLPPGEGVHFLAILWAVIIGLRDMTSPSPVGCRALGLPTLAPLRLEFDPALRDIVGIVLVGLKAKYDLSKPPRVTRAQVRSRSR
jgi:AcrR family transcriptional regulator